MASPCFKSKSPQGEPTENTTQQGSSTYEWTKKQHSAQPAMLSLSANKGTLSTEQYHTEQAKTTTNAEKSH